MFVCALEVQTAGTYPVRRQRKLRFKLYRIWSADGQPIPCIAKKWQRESRRKAADALLVSAGYRKISFRLLLINQFGNRSDVSAAVQFQTGFWKSRGKKRNPASKDSRHDVNVISIDQILKHKTADDFTTAHKPDISRVSLVNEIQ